MYTLLPLLVLRAVCARFTNNEALDLGKINKAGRLPPKRINISFLLAARLVQLVFW